MTCGYCGHLWPCRCIHDEEQRQVAPEQPPRTYIDVHWRTGMDDKLTPEERAVVLAALDAVEETVKVYQPISLDSLYDQFAKHFSQIQFEAIIALLLNEGRIYQDAQHRLRAGGRN